MGYPPTTRIYLAGSEIFGGHRVLIPLHAMYTNLVDLTSLCSKQELHNLRGPETSLPLDFFQPPPAKSEKELKEEWDKAGPRPRPLPPPPGRPIYRHEKEGWYGWVAEKDSEPNPSPSDLREQAHRLLWAALDYIVSVEADAFFPGFDNDGSGWPDFSSLVMGHRLDQTGNFLLNFSVVPAIVFIILHAIGLSQCESILTKAWQRRALCGNFLYQNQGHFFPTQFRNAHV